MPIHLNPAKLAGLENGGGKLGVKLGAITESSMSSINPEEDDGSDPVHLGELEVIKPGTVLNYIKLTVLTGFCILSVVLIACVKHEEINFVTFPVSPNDSTIYYFSNTSHSPQLARFAFHGPFLHEGAIDGSSIHLNASVFRHCNISNEETFNLRTSWVLPFEDIEHALIHHIERKTVHKRYQLHELPLDCEEYIVLETNLVEPVSIGIALSTFPGRITPSVIYAALILVGMYLLITFEIVHRTLAALIASTVSVAVLSGLRGKPSMEEIVSWLDVETLCLLFGMMLMVAVLSESGFFDWVAVFTFQISKGDPWKVITYLSVFTAVISAFLDNVTTVLLLTPVTIRLCEVIQLDPVPVLILTVLFSNIGGAATPIGDPPNVLIVSNQGIKQRGINFGNFTVHMMIGAVIAFLTVYGVVRWWYNDLKGIQVKHSHEVAALKRGMNEVRRHSRRFSTISTHDEVRKKVAHHMFKRLHHEVNKLQSVESMIKEQSFKATLADLKKKYGIRNQALLIRCLVVLVLVILLFFVQTSEGVHLTLGWTAIIGAISVLVLSDVDDVDHLLARVEWPTLLFFAALFVLMESLDKLGLLEVLGDAVEEGILAVHPDYRLLAAMMMILWISALASAIIDNIPFATMMITILINIAENEELDLPLPPLVWALAFGACFGGNGTLIGASANVVCAGVAEQHGHTITFNQFTKMGFPIMIISVLSATVYLLICHIALDWNYV